MDISIIVPLYNEAESLPELTQWIERVMKDNGFSYEILFINDGSSDNSWDVISSLKANNSAIRGVSFRRNYGKSPALNTGFMRANGDVVITMDADMQDSPDEIPELYRMIKEEEYDLVSGWKQKRYDPLSKTLPTKLFNATARSVSGIRLHDFNCGLKAYRNKVVKHIEVYGDMHRYIPYLAKNAGFNKIGEKIVQH
ncbi:MAG: glycosyltransferase family 2 protein, partial [Muribaculaceae bacterium]